MRFRKQWLALLLTTAMTAANLTLPYSAVGALAAETQTVEEDVPEEQNADGETSEQTDEDQDLSMPSGVTGDDDSAAPGGSSLSDEEAEETEEAGSDNEEISNGDLENAESDSGEESDADDADKNSSAPEEEDAEDQHLEDEDQQSNDGVSTEAQNAGDIETPEIGTDDAAQTGESTAPAPGTEPANDENQIFVRKKPDFKDLDPDDNPFADAPETDNDQAFAGYVNRELELTSDLRTDEGDIAERSDKLQKNFASSRLTGYKRKLYDILAAQVRKVAAGDLTNTHFKITASQLGLKGKMWTASQLGVPSLFGYDSISEDAIAALEKKLGLSADNYFDEILPCLVADFPYDLYWYDKTSGEKNKYSAFGYYVDLVNNQWVLKLSEEEDYIDCLLPVCSEYSASGEAHTYKADPGIGSAVSASRNMARSIVSKYAGKTDYEKMDGYRKEICSLVDYNDFAAEYSNYLDYGNPWQLIWTFDGDSSTNVVCEGYSKSFQYLCDLSSWTGIFKECISVTGDLITSDERGGHMWNIVSLKDGRSFLADITNCDDYGPSDNRDLFLVGTGSASASEVYAQGDVYGGYYIAYYGDLGYVYDDYMFDVFGKPILTLAAGRVDKNTKNYQRITLNVEKAIPVKMTTKVIVSNVFETSDITFVSSDTSVAPITSKGNVTGKKVGTVTFTVTTPATKNYYAGKATVKLKVIDALKKPGNCHFVKWNNSKYNSCRIGWNKAEGAQGYQTLLSWTDGSHAVWKSTGASPLYQDCSVAVNHVSQIKVRAYFTTNTGRQFGPWSNVEYITPSPTKLTKKDVSSSSKDLKMKIGWNIIYGCNGYNVFITTNPKGTWYWNQSTPVNATATSAVITKYRGSKMKKHTNYYVRIVTRRKRNGVFCTVPMPASNTNIGYFVFK